MPSAMFMYYSPTSIFQKIWAVYPSSTLMVSFAEFGGKDGTFWIGLKWELDWKWAYSKTDINFTFWGQGFPNWEGGNRDCGSIKFDKAEDGHWENVDCGITL